MDKPTANIFFILKKLHTQMTTLPLSYRNISPK